MKSDAILHARFADLLDDGLSEIPVAVPPVGVEIVRSLDTVYGGAEPPSGFVAHTQALLASGAGRNRSVFARFTAPRWSTAMSSEV